MPNSDLVSHRIKTKKYQDALVDLITYYNSNVEPIVVRATAANNGIRPENLSNEVYSAFHHISRGLTTNDDTDKKGIEELQDKAKRHFLRVVLDAYKISISDVLQESEALLPTLDFIFLHRDYKDSLLQYTDLYNSVRKLRRDLKEAYIAAQTFERDGTHEKAMEKYSAALTYADELEKSVDTFKEQDAFRLAIKRIENEKIEKRRDTRNNRIWNVATLVLAALLSVFVPQVINRCSNTNSASNTTITNVSP